MNNVKLTKKSFDNLIDGPIGAGKIFIHSGTNELTSFDIYLAQNGNYYVVNDFFPSTPAAEQLADIGKELKNIE